MGEQGFPQQFGRYCNLELIGEGGMGRVYRAFDPTLGRPVALKLLKAEDPDLAQRLLLEARAQAHIDHPNVCRVYEAGEILGKRYIALQYLNGRSLMDVVGEMTLETKTRLFHQVAEAVHAAHRGGIIHRDIKPNNILVERTEEGAWIPYVMDFGLAREMAAPGLTATGIVIGTPWYMSPEQARGATHEIDRRSDVYSLGATFYEVYTGKVPFDDESSLTILVRVVSDEAVPARQMNPSIPGDLETILMKCLEKEPSRRYDSARALAEDLDRFLEGEPVLAKPSRWNHRLYKKIKKYPAFSATLAAAGIAILFLVGFTLQTTVQSRKQARLLQEFGQEVKEMEAIMRYAHLLPRHDVSPERKLVRSHLESMKMRIQSLGGAANGPGHYALGRGYITLREFPDAKKHLDLAWNQYKYREPHVAYAIGLTLAMLYELELKKTERIPAKQKREEVLKQIEKDFGEPALRYMKEGRGSTSDAPEYIEALISFLEKKYDDSLQKAEIACKKVPWLYEARKLQGDAYYAKATLKRRSGDYSGWSELSSKSAETYQLAIQSGASDAAGYQALCDLKGEMVITHVYETAASPESDFKDGLQACNDALAIQPDNAEAYRILARLYGIWGGYQTYEGKDPQPEIEKSVRASQKSVQLDPQNAASYYTLAAASNTLAQYRISVRSDPRESLAQAAQNASKGLALDPNCIGCVNNLGLAYRKTAQYEFDHGMDPRSSLQKAVEAYQNAIRIDPTYVPIYNHLAVAYQSHCEYECYAGSDPQKACDRAVTAYRKTLQVNPNYSIAYSNLAGTYWFFARYLLDHQQDPSPLLKDGRIALQKSIGLNPDDFEPYLNLGAIEVLAAKASLKQKQDPGSLLASAEKAIEDALKRNDQFAATHVLKAELSLVKNLWKPSRPQLQKGLESVEKALQINPEFPEAHGMKGELLLALAQQSAGKTAKDLSARAAGELEAAIKINPNLRRLYDPSLQKARSAN